MKLILTKIRSYSQIRLLYFGSMLFFFIFSLLNCIRTNGIALYDMLVPNYNNHYWDLFTSIYHNFLRTPYKEGVIYPPGANFICWVMSNFFSEEQYYRGVNTMRDSQTGLIIMLIFILSTMIFLIVLLNKAFNAKPFEKILLVVTCLFSAPFIREISKINIITLCVILTYFFLLYRNDVRGYMQILAFFCLACAVSIKLYPVFFGLFLLKEKKWQEANTCILIGAFVFFLPFFFFGGISGLPLMFKNILNTTTIFTESGLGFKINIANTVNILGELLKANSSNVQLIGNILNYFILCCAILSFFFLHCDWKSTALLSLVFLSYPSFSNSYAVLFLIPALVMFLNTEEKLTIENIFYAVLFVLLFAPMCFGGQDIFPSLKGVTRVNLFTFIESISIILMETALIVEGFLQLYKKVKYPAASCGE